MFKEKIFNGTLKRDSGFSLMEVLVAVAILSITTASLTSGFVNNSKMNTKSEIKTEAIQVAQMILDELRVNRMVSLGLTGMLTYDYEMGDRSYQIDVELCAAPQYCPPVTTPSTRHLTVNVSYEGNHIYEIQTVYTDLV